MNVLNGRTNLVPALFSVRFAQNIIRSFESSFIMTAWKAWISSSLDKYKSFETILGDLKYVRPRAPTVVAKAKEILQDLEIDLNYRFKEEDATEILAVRALLKFQAGSVEVLNEEFCSGFASLLESWELIKDSSHDPFCCMLALNILHMLSVCFICRKEHLEKALAYLNEAECLYQDFKKNSNNCPKDVADIFSVFSESLESWKPFEVTHTLTLFHLGTVYELLEEFEKTAKYYELFLSRYNDFVELNAKEWVLKVGSLSCFYVLRKYYVVARHLLSCASFVFSSYEASSDDNEQVKIHLSFIKADISLFWVNYCQNLLSDIKDDDYFMLLIPSRRPQLYVDHPEVRAFAMKAPISVTTFSEARDAFLFGQQHVEQAKLHHTFSEDPTNYIELESFRNTLYEILTKFENDLGRRSKMFKRSIDVLEDILSKISVQTYPCQWKILQYKLAFNYCAMFQNKCTVLENVSQDQKAAAVRKVKSLALKSINCYEKFLQVLKNEDEAFPEVFPNDVARNALKAHANIGQLYRLINALDISLSEQLANVGKIKKYFKFLLDYLERNPSHCCFVENEWPEIRHICECFSFVEGLIP